MPLQARNILITGAAKGLGKYLVKSLSENGHQIFVLDHNTWKDFPSNYRECVREYYQVELSNWGAVDSAVSNIVSKYKSVDVLINNGALRIFKKLCDFELEGIERYIMVNFQVPVLLTRKLVPIMIANCYGRIINIASKSAFGGYRDGSMYCSSKSALVAFTESVAAELDVQEDNVTINAICPDAFRSGAGDDLSGSEYIMGRIETTVNDILHSCRNGEVIPVLHRRTKIREIVRQFRRHGLWIVKY